MKYIVPTTKHFTTSNLFDNQYTNPTYISQAPVLTSYILTRIKTIQKQLVNLQSVSPVEHRVHF